MNIAENLDSADFADKRKAVASDEQEGATSGLDEYAVYYESGEPLGEGFGLSHREAALWWARETESQGDFIQVQRGVESHTYWVDTHRDGSATVREVSQ